MAYLEPAEYPKYGLPVGTTADWIRAATALINTFCRRPDLNVVQYTERLRITAGVRTVRLTYLPLTPLAPAASALVSIEGRWANARRGELVQDAVAEMAVAAFALPGEWAAIDPGQVDVDPSTGELTLPWNIFGVPYTEVKVSYAAGLATIGDDVKSACAQIVRNAQATPALNASRTKMDTMWMEYFSSSLIDDTVKAWLKPYVASRLG